MTLYFVQMPEDRRVVFKRQTSKKLSGPGCSKHYSLNNMFVKDSLGLQEHINQVCSFLFLLK